MGRDSNLNKKDYSGIERFAMVNAMHKKSLEKAIQEKKADKQIIPLCRFVSKTKNFFTSSSCAGRIILLQLPKGESKREACFHRKWHCVVKEKELWEGIDAETKGELWFKLDPFIFHVGANSLENAKKVLAAMTKAGVKRGGIIVAKPGKFLVELKGRNKGMVTKSDRLTHLEAERQNQSYGHPSMRVFEWRKKDNE